MNSKAASNPKADRVGSIDAFRAVTMLLMLWVNDFWTLVDIPNWLQHQAADDDALGFSDTIFPAFLFAVGLSIPFAIENRAQRGDSKLAQLRHIATRALALVVMGIFMVNLENIAPTLPVIGKLGWQVLMTLAFFLIWNLYPKTGSWKRAAPYLKTTGWLILVGLAIVYQGAGEPPSWMKTHWWGILGLIGWCYLIAATIYLYLPRTLMAMALAWIGFALFNIAEFTHLFDALDPIKNYVWIVSGGSLPAMTLAGVFVSTLYRHRSQNTDEYRFVLTLVAIGIATLAVGILLRPYWEISKIRATPAWTEICTGLSILSFALLYWIVDVKRLVSWTRLLAPAGTATLTCYLVPYFVYAVVMFLGFSLPEALRTGSIGLVKSMLFACFIVGLTAVLSRYKIKLRI